MKAALSLCALLLGAASARADLSPEELARIAQNPVGAMVSLPLQNNTNFNVGPRSGTQNILNIQPVIPITLDADWNLITRTILPVIWQPGFTPDQGSSFGLGDMQFAAMLSPSQPAPGGWIWGAGPILQLPTNTRDELGNKNWGLGPQGVVLRMEKGSPWVYGVLVNNIWSLSSGQQGGRYNNLLLQPFVEFAFMDVTVANARLLGLAFRQRLQRRAVEERHLHEPRVDVKAQEPRILDLSVKRRIPFHRLLHARDGLGDDRIKPHANIASPTGGHSCDVSLHRRIAVAFGNLRIAAGQELWLRRFLWRGLGLGRLFDRFPDHDALSSCAATSRRTAGRTCRCRSTTATPMAATARMTST